MEVSTVWRPAEPLDLPRTLAPLQRGPHDPAQQVAPDGSVWRCSRLPSGPVTYRLGQRGAEICCTAWGPGAAELVASLSMIFGDPPRKLAPAHPLVTELDRRHRAVRVPRTGRVLEALVPGVLEQKVTGLQAHRAWRWLLRRFGAIAPGPAPAGMRVPPDASEWRLVPSWEWHRAGVEPVRSRTILAACQLAGRLEEASGLAADLALARLQAVPGVGPWTAAEVAQRALGDEDAVSVGDLHLPGLVGQALSGAPADDERMLELLEPWRGQRQRVVRLLELSGLRPQRRGPRLTIQDHRGH